MSDEIPYLPYNQFVSNEELEAILSKPVLKDWVSEIKVDDSVYIILIKKSKDGFYKYKSICIV